MIRGISWIDWKLGARMLVKYPGLTLIGGLTLAVAIGIGAAWFEVTRQILNPRLPLPDGDRIVRIDNWDLAAAQPEPRSAYDYQLWRDQIRSIRQLGAYRASERNLITPDGNAQPVAAAEISPSAFPLARVPALLGRTLLAADAAPGAPDVVVIGHDLWQSRFNGEADVVGKVVRLGRTPATVVGVMPAGFHFPVRQEVWSPLRLAESAPRQGPGISIFGRLADGVSIESAQAELTMIGQRSAAQNPNTHAQLRPRVMAYAARVPNSDAAKQLRLSNILAWLILAAASANVATLMFARTATREAEIVVRNALGASRLRVMAQLVTEAFVLCAAAAVAGLMAASFGLDLVVQRMNAGDSRLPFWFQFDIGPMTMVYAAVLALAGAVLVALLPALRATGPRVQKALTSNATGSSIAFGGVWSVMIVLQVAFAALCLPIGLGAALEIVLESRKPIPLPAHEYLTFTTGSSQRAELASVYAELKERLEKEPAVRAVTFGNALPLLSYPLGQVEAQRADGRPYLVDAQIEGDRVRAAAVDINFFDAFRFPLLSGRAFQASDARAETSVIINETLARTLGGNPIGQRLRFAAHGNEPAGPWFDVIGVVRDVGRDDDPADRIYRPVALSKLAEPMVAVHIRGAADSFAPRLRALAAETDPELRVHELIPLDEVVHRKRMSDVRIMSAVVALMVVVLALSGLGLYSLMAVAVTRRTREIGIRLAIGGTPRAVLTSLFARAATQVTIGIVVANALLPALMTALGNSEPWPLVMRLMVISATGMLLVALVACGVPARRALRIQATEAMRYTG